MPHEHPRALAVQLAPSPTPPRASATGLGESEADSPARTGQLDPFLLPSPTTYRFVLLIALVASVTCILFIILHNSVPSFWETRMAISKTCDAIANPLDARGMEIPSEGALLRARCMDPVNRAQGLSVLFGLVLLLAATFVFYWVAPARKMKRDGLEPLGSDDAPEVLAVLGDLSRKAGIDPLPSFVWSPTQAAVSGVAFGRRGHYYVSLTGGLVGAFYTDRPAFSAIVLHELAHIRNGDIDRTYLAVASFRAFLVVGLLPFLVSRFWVPSVTLAFGVRLLGLTSLVLLTRNEVLRVREFYADLRAQRWEGPNSALSRVVGSSRRSSRATWSARRLDFHPTAQQRSEILANPSPLFRPELILAVATGVTAMTGIHGIATLFNDLFVSRFSGWLAQLDPGEVVSCTLMGGLSAYVIGADLWEAELLASCRAQNSLGGLRMGLGLGVGLLIGSWLDPTAIVTAKLADSPLGVALWALAATGVCVLTTKAFADAVHAWLLLGGRRRFLARARSASLAIYALLIALWLAALSYAKYAMMSSHASDSAWLARFENPEVFQAFLPFIPFMLTGFLLVVGAVPTLTMVTLGLLPFLVTRGTSRGSGATDVLVAGNGFEPPVLRPARAVLFGIAVGVLPLVVGYLQNGKLGVMLTIGATGLSWSLVLALVLASTILTRRAPLLGWLHAITCSLAAGVISWVGLWIVSNEVDVAFASEFQVSALNVSAWLAAATGLLAACWRTQRQRGRREVRGAAP